MADAKSSRRKLYGSVISRLNLATSIVGFVNTISSPEPSFDYNIAPLGYRGTRFMGHFSLAPQLDVRVDMSLGFDS
ncbi:MAG TPA: hypothetical protein PKN52_03665, partial [Trueperaceae bacterium]|nr:hypothetical protein [Trueperaceae bacterium]